ncbi:uncharacterized protein [Hoplias malabaricus]
MAWYLQRDDEFKHILSAVRGKLNTAYTENQNADPGHFHLSVGSMNNSVNLVIVGVRESDVGFYYCGWSLQKAYMDFGKPIHLTLPGYGQSAEEGTVFCWKLLIAACCPLALALGFCVSVLLCKRGAPSSFCMNCVKQNSSFKGEDLQYASLRHPPQTQERYKVPPENNVTYDVVSRNIKNPPRI